MSLELSMLREQNPSRVSALKLCWILSLFHKLALSTLWSSWFVCDLNNWEQFLDATLLNIFHFPLPLFHSLNITPQNPTRFYKKILVKNNFNEDFIRIMNIKPSKTNLHSLYAMFLWGEKPLFLVIVLNNYILFYATNLAKLLSWLNCYLQKDVWWWSIARHWLRPGETVMRHKGIKRRY